MCHRIDNNLPKHFFGDFQLFLMGPAIRYGYDGVQLSLYEFD